ncbi:uncharacterized protein LOC143475167 [Brachyhypopomus gauderio]|uniref:uncharacterized protein LOC143475167 n=1 Tax=Brachyhypopomus gauderio TaxID=698409 RepID=UPI0040417FB0
MDEIKDSYQHIQPVTLRLTEHSVTSRLYCSPAKGIDAHLSAMVETFLVEVFRCRQCQFTSSQKARISSHVTARHSSPSPSPRRPLSCLEREDEESLTVGMRVEEESELEQSGSPYDLHPVSKNSEDQMDMERMSFLLPMYGMLPNTSPPPHDVILGPNSDGGLHVARTCEVSTLFEEDRCGEDGEEESIFHLEDPGDGLPGPLSATVTPDTEDQDEVTAQSAHLMTLGLCRISSAKCPLQSAAVPEAGQDASDNVDEKQDLLPAAEVLKQSEDELLCGLCRAAMPNQGVLEVHLKCHDAVQGFRCPHCGWAASQWPDMARHWRTHGRKRSAKTHKCAICPRKFRRAESRDSHENRHKRHRGAQLQASPLGQCPLGLEVCCSDREWQPHQRCHVQGAFKCVYCDVTEKSWKKIHKHLLSHTEEGAGHVPQTSYSPGPLKFDSRTSTSSPESPAGLQLEAWGHVRKKRVKHKTARRRKRDEENRDEEKRDDDACVKGRRGQRREFCCTVCNRTFSTKLTLRRHMGIHQGLKPFTCPHCNYCTRLKASLVQHLRVHTGEKPYKCPHCPYASIDRSSLRRHSRTHTHEKPYHCQYCPYSSIQKKSLTLHSRRHHTGEAFACPLCQYTTPDRQLLRRHTHRHHPSDSAHTPRADPPPSAHSGPVKRPRTSKTS